MLSDIPVITPSLLVYTLVLFVNLLFLPEYFMRLSVFSAGRCTGQCVPSAVTSPPPGPGTILLNSPLVLHAAISFETFLAVGSTDASIRSITLRYLHTLVWSTPKIACSVPCVGLSFLRMSDMSRTCLKRSLHRFPGLGAPDSSSRNSGMSPEAIAHAPARSKIYRNSSLLHRVAECRLDSSDMTPVKHLDPVQVHAGT